VIAFQPWDYHPELTIDRLVEVANLIVKGRDNAVEHHNEEIGDDEWVLGCRAFQLARAEILRAAASGRHEWLTIINDSKQLVFAIGSIPVRFYRGLAEEPNERTVRQSYPELKQLSLAFIEKPELEGLAFRFAVETELDGSVQSVKFVGLRGDVAECCFEVPIEQKVVRLSAVALAREEGVALDAPNVGDVDEQDLDSTGKTA
jgi:hypothetical protein